ncbi:dipeptidase [Halanaerobium sp.]|uniref:dipeptidase n=1 Tax=Halanaerobium sp. TaxID=1895664 RepID=UPI000DE67199|nr:dipeptidase [Halanaerobium sp.]PUU94589.1 MAG: membrane dipeptidase [Halanaerobium sp.]
MIDLGYIDLHCDSLLRIYNKYDQDNLLENNKLSVDFKGLKAGGALAQFFAIFMPDQSTLEELNLAQIDDDLYIEDLLNILKNEVKKNNKMIEMAYNYRDLLNNKNENKISAFLTIEDGRSVNGDLEKIKKYYELGVRLITLSWNYENCFGWPNSDNQEIMKKGLKQFGVEAVKYMNKIGIIIDVSHLSDGGFYDVAEHSEKPFVASHSNVRSLAANPRNLKDDMITKIAEKGGVIGLNFAPQLLNKNSADKRSRLEEMIEHLNYIKNIGGESVLALGSDFDGIQGDLEITKSSEMPLLFKALKKDGWSDDLIDKFRLENVLRVIKEVLN